MARDALMQHKLLKSKALNIENVWHIFRCKDRGNRNVWHIFRCKDRGNRNVLHIFRYSNFGRYFNRPPYALTLTRCPLMRHSIRLFRLWTFQCFDLRWKSGTVQLTLIQSPSWYSTWRPTMTGVLDCQAPSETCELLTTASRVGSIGRWRRRWKRGKKDKDK